MYPPLFVCIYVCACHVSVYVSVCVGHVLHTHTQCYLLAASPFPTMWDIRKYLSLDLSLPSRWIFPTSMFGSVTVDPGISIATMSPILVSSPSLSLSPLPHAAGSRVDDSPATSVPAGGQEDRLEQVLFAAQSQTEGCIGGCGCCYGMVWYVCCVHMRSRLRVDIAVPTHRPPAVPHGCGHRFLVAL